MSMSRQCVAVCMARNNGDVIHAFMEHLLALFDHAVIIDHRSTDGTKEYLDALADRYPQQLSLYHFLDEGFYQSELMTWIARNKAACREADWLFFLDTDEFLPFGDRSAFDAALYAFRDEAVIRMPWKNLAPVTYDDSSLHERSYYAAKQESVFCKIAFQPGLLDPDDLIVLQGNHALQRAGSGKKLKGRHAFPLLHVPITNREQYALKVLLIHLADISKGADSEESFRKHRYKRIEPVERHGLSDALLNASALHYGEKTFSIDGYGELASNAACEHMERFAVARTKIDPVATRFDDFPTSIVKLVGQNLLHVQPNFMSNDSWDFVIDDNRLSISPAATKTSELSAPSNWLQRIRGLFR